MNKECFGLLHFSLEELKTLNKTFYSQCLNIGLDETVLTKEFQIKI